MKKLAYLLSMSSWLVAAQAQAQSAAPSVPTFDVLEFVVEGNTVLPPALVEAAVAPFMGPGKTFKDMEAARKALEKAYQDAGYLSVLVNLPDQRVDTGEVKLDVIQATVEKLKVTGSQYHLPSVIAGKVPSLAQGQVPYFPAVQAQLALAQSAEVEVTPLIGPAQDPRQIEVELKVKDQLPIRGGVEANSRQTFNASRGRTEAVLMYGNLYQREHAAGLGWTYAPMRPGDANTLAGLYSLPLSSTQLMSLYYARSNTNTPTKSSLGGATFTRGRYAGLVLHSDLNARQWPVTHGLDFGLDFKRSNDRNEGIGGVSINKPDLRYTVASARYDLSWRGEGENITNWRAGVYTSLRALSEREVDCNGVKLEQFACKRSGASADFMQLKLGMGRAQTLPANWTLKFDLDLQLASGPMAPSEQMSLGGVDTVRGYYDYEQSGDQGWNSRLELVSPVWLKLKDEEGIKAVAFWDRGELRLIKALATEKPIVQLGSIGLGLRLNNAQGLTAKLDLAIPIYDTTKPTESGGVESATGGQDKRRWRLDLAVRQSF
ncbi:MAG: ShlB/FhaC/HecB family hemolysin secretion/activation protein [Aquabacterium sp.]|nr:ShlB/FhaC/HecB family hemolysin secretion/activation protein [Aquabacterium sp.]